MVLARERPTPTVEHWIEKRERMARHIERCALEVLGEEGADDVTVERIAEAAGISVRTFFRYFRSRDDLVTAMPRRQNERLCARFVARPASEPIIEAFLAAVRLQSAADDDEDPDIVKVWGRAWQRGAVVVRQAEASDWGMTVQLAEAIGERLGLEPDHPRVDVMATTMASVMWASFRQWHAAGAARPLHEVVEESFDVVRDLGRPPSGTGRRRSGTNRRPGWT